MQWACDSDCLRGLACDASGSDAKSLGRRPALFSPSNRFCPSRGLISLLPHAGVLGEKLDYLLSPPPPPKKNLISMGFSSDVSKEKMVLSRKCFCCFFSLFSLPGGSVWGVSRIQVFFSCFFFFQFFLVFFLSVWGVGLGS